MLYPAWNVLWIHWVRYQANCGCGQWICECGLKFSCTLHAILIIVPLEQVRTVLMNQTTHLPSAGSGSVMVHETRYPCDSLQLQYFGSSWNLTESTGMQTSCDNKHSYMHLHYLLTASKLKGLLSILLLSCSMATYFSGSSLWWGASLSEPYIVG